MALSAKVTYAVAAVLCLATHLQEAIAQNTQDSAFSQILAYSTSIEALSRQYAAHSRDRAELFQESEEIQRGLADTEMDLNRVSVQGVVNQLRMLENQIALNSTMEDWKRLSSVDTWREAMASGQSDLNFRRQRAATAVSARLQATNTTTLQGTGLQLDAAARSVVERRQKLLMSAQDVVRRVQAWNKDDRQLIDQYLELADVAGTRSRLELRAALRVLEAAEPDNAGARLAKAITLLRLGRPDEATELLKELWQQPAVRPLALAVYGELLARAGDTPRAKKCVHDAVRLASDRPIAHWLRAQSSALIKEPETAIAGWQTLLKLGGHDIAAHRGLALTSCSLSASNARYQKLAMEHAKLAYSLSGEKDWSSQIALALATAVGGDLPAAATLAEAAAEKAIGERRQQCLEIAAQLKAGQIPAWEF